MYINKLKLWAGGFQFLVCSRSTIMTPSPMDKALELHVLGSSQGACHPLWSQMLTHKIVWVKQFTLVLFLSHKVYRT
jgi:hypothetical protein